MSSTLKEIIIRSVQFLNRTDGSLSSKVFRSGFWVVFSALSTNVLSLARNIILARLLAPEIFGLMGICLMVIRGVELFTETGFSAALIHREDKVEEAKNTAFTLIVLRGVILLLIVICLSYPVADYYEKPELSLLVKAIALVLLFNGFGNINLVIRERNLDYKNLTYLKQVTTLLDFTFVITLTYFYRNVWALVLGQIFVSFISNLLSYIFVPGRPKLQFNPTMAKELFGYGKYITGLVIVVYTASEIDNAVIGKVLGMEMLGYYVIAYMLANIPATHIAKVASRVFFPAYCKLQDDLAALQSAYLKVLKLLSAITTPAAAGIAVLAPEIIQYVYGEKWLPAVSSLQILCIFGACRSIIAINGYLYNGIGKPNISFYINIFRLALIAMIIYPLTKSFSLIGTSLAVTVPISVQLIIDIIVFTKTLKLSKSAVVNTLMPTVTTTAIMACTLFVLKSVFPIHSILMLMFFIVVGAVQYTLLNLKYLFQLKEQIATILNSK